MVWPTMGGTRARALTKRDLKMKTPELTLETVASQEYWGTVATGQQYTLYILTTVALDSDRDEIYTGVVFIMDRISPVEGEPEMKFYDLNLAIRCFNRLEQNEK